MAGAPEVVQLPIAGMTCEHCVGTVRRALVGVPGVRSAAVDLKTGRAEVTLDPERADRARLKGAVEAAGYSVPDRTGPPPANLVTIGLGPMPAPPPAPPESAPEEWNLAIGGMHCASCVARVEGRWRRCLASVRRGSTWPPNAPASSSIPPAWTSTGSPRRSPAPAIRPAGRSSSRGWGPRPCAGSGPSRSPTGAGGWSSAWRWRSRSSCWDTPRCSRRAWGHAAWVAWVMFALAAVLQAYLGGPYLKGAWRRLKQGSSNMDTLIALGTSTAFGFSVVQLLVGHAGPSRFLWGAAGVAIAVAISVAGAVLFGDPPRFAEGQSPGELTKP